jgi:hypothetical protein
MTTIEKLMTWNRQWRLGAGMLLCRACHAQQIEAERAVAFKHDPGCESENLHSFPWNDLDATSVKPVQLPQAPEPILQPSIPF